MPDRPFTHIHVHTQYSLLDGTIKTKDLAKRCKEVGMTACAITDHGSMAGIVEFYKACKAEGVKPLIGIEAYITNDHDGIEDNSLKTKDNYHLVLIAKDQEGYKLLLELASNAALNNFYYKPRIYKQHLSRLSGHVIASTACLAGELSRVAYLENRPELLDFYIDTFGDDLYLELQDWDDGTQVQILYNRWLLSMREKYPRVKYVLTCDAHYLTKEDHALHELVIAMQLKKTLDQYREDGRMVYGPDFYIKSSEEMWIAAQEWDCEEAYHNTAEIADKCSVDIELGVYHMPRFSVENAPDYQDFLKWKEKQNG